MTAAYIILLLLYFCSGWAQEILAESLSITQDISKTTTDTIAVVFSPYSDTIFCTICRTTTVGVCENSELDIQDNIYFYSGLEAGEDYRFSCGPAKAEAVLSTKPVTPTISNVIESSNNSIVVSFAEDDTIPIPAFPVGRKYAAKMACATPVIGNQVCKSNSGLSSGQIIISGLPQGTTYNVTLYEVRTLLSDPSVNWTITTSGIPEPLYVKNLDSNPQNFVVSWVTPVGNSIDQFIVCV